MKKLIFITVVSLLVFWNCMSQQVFITGTGDTVIITPRIISITTNDVIFKPYKPPIPPDPNPVNAFHVASNGNDANSGSLSAPWKTIAKINGRTFAAGDNILLRRGDMWREQLTIPASGITIGAYGTGAKPIINGADIKTGWVQGYTNVNGNIWGTSSMEKSMVVINGIIYEETAGLNQLTSPNKYFIKKASTPDSVYVYSTVDPDNLVAEVSKRYFCIATNSLFNSKKNVTIDGIEVRYAARAGIYFEGPSANPSTVFNGNSVVKNCLAYANREFGMCHVDHYDNILFEDCEANFNGNGLYSWEADEGTFRRCSTANQIHYEGITAFTDGGAIQGYRSDNWIVENCYSINDYDAIHIDCGGVAANGIMRYNKVFNSRAGNPNTPTMGVGTSGAGSKIQIYYNLLVNGASAALECYSTMQGKVEFYNNTIYIKAGSGTDGTVYLKNGANFTFKNNIITREGAARGFHTVLYPQMSVNDYNVYWNYPPVTTNQFYYQRYYATIHAWRIGTGQDMNSLVVDPMFINRISDWSLQAGSPAINKGVNVGLTKDINGNPIVGLPDCGAFEKQ